MQLSRLGNQCIICSTCSLRAGSSRRLSTLNSPELLQFYNRRRGCGARTHRITLFPSGGSGAHHFVELRARQVVTVCYDRGDSSRVRDIGQRIHIEKQEIRPVCGPATSLRLQIHRRFSRLEIGRHREVIVHDEPAAMDLL
jgi:hypothetical protein